MMLSMLGVVLILSSRYVIADEEKMNDPKRRIVNYGLILVGLIMFHVGVTMQDKKRDNQISAKKPTKTVTKTMGQ